MTRMAYLPARNRQRPRQAELRSADLGGASSWDLDSGWSSSETVCVGASSFRSYCWLHVWPTRSVTFRHLPAFLDPAAATRDGGDLSTGGAPAFASANKVVYSATAVGREAGWHTGAHSRPSRAIGRSARAGRLALEELHAVRLFAYQVEHAHRPNHVRLSLGDRRGGGMVSCDLSQHIRPNAHAHTATPAGPVAKHAGPIRPLRRGPLIARQARG